jgi:flavin-dependent dehydrogenase
MPDGSTNVCVVTGPRPEGRTPLDVLRTAIALDPSLADRLASARFDRPVRVLGPLAVDVTMPGADGVLFAGDAAGFIDPITGDGLRLAIAGGILAAEEALVVLERGDYSGAPSRLARARHLQMGSKLRFNRAIRLLTSFPAAVGVAGLGARLVPAVVRRAVRYAGDAE